MKERNMITSWLDQNGDPEIEKYIETNLAITEKVRLAIERKGWKTKDLATAMGKSPSEVSKWLSGMHNLTLKSIVKMEIALGVDLLNVENEKNIQYVYLGAIEGGKSIQEPGDYEHTEYSSAV